ncbi:DUF1364 family protein [Bordetella bronchiseptica]|uniref:DUF1364 family protein n=1 Tax=Bordetella bronchiseptica 253 TaxID=568707 RepID=A0A0C6P063_BORBO|nr:DUF1364 family protein [Bordetella bronchiseptica]KDD12552.1 PF07102 family protein [Bordetella bronchiseptica MBORD731]KDD38936.1 PF07102 family protein [Bordetella bronchiseptica MBORD839]KDD83907.1 PF07102 family protein [Bordetella bronchiseptica MBORD762]KFJ54448.1 hypothetical protein DK45_2251 [Bordetella bronchiseptica]MCE7075209.1 hypothetical protein [Bordetella bronchiseptica]
MNLARRTPMSRKTPLRASTGLARAAIKRRAPKKRPGYHDPKYLAACKGECCYLRFPGCRSYPEDPTVVPAHQNEGKGMGLKVHDKFTVPACFHCHALYDQSGIDREIKRATFDWAYTRWVPVRAGKLGLQHVETL